MKNVLKRSIVVISFVLLIICAVSCVNAQDDDSDITMMTLSKGGLVIKYPSNWGCAQAESNCSIMSIAKLDSIDASGVGQVNINFEKKSYEGDFETYLNNTYGTLKKDPSFNLTASGEVMVNNVHAYEYTYSSEKNGTVKEHKAVWFEKGGQAYVMLYSAPVSEYDDNVYVFNYILSDIQIT